MRELHASPQRGLLTFTTPCRPAAWASRGKGHAEWMHRQVVILGAGFGGLELSTLLSERLADEVEVTLIDQNDAFTLGFSKLDILFNHQTRDAVRLPYRRLTKPSVAFRQETVLSIDPGRRRWLPMRRRTRRISW